MNRGALAAAIHRRMVDDDSFGYSWEERYGAIPETWTVNGHTFTMSVGDYDCSSSTITAWKKALEGTKWAHSLDGATFTGNMRAVFTASGLFEWKPAGFSAEPGDLYLNESNHVAMCQGGGILSEFCWGDNGAYGNRRGDQSGREAYAHGFYSYPWDGVLHYNHRADDQPKPKPKGDDVQLVTNTGGTVRRFHDPHGDRHLLTMAKNEIAALKKAGWTDEGAAFKAPKGGTVAVYRMGGPDGDYLYTADFNEARELQKQGWEYEGVPWFGKDTGTDVYRLYRDGRHLFTADKNEYDTLARQGWTKEGVAWRC